MNALGMTAPTPGTNVVDMPAPRPIDAALAAADRRIGELGRIIAHLQAEGIEPDEALLMETAEAEMEFDAIVALRDAGCTHPHEQIAYEPQDLEIDAPLRLPMAA